MFARAAARKENRGAEMRAEAGGEAESHNAAPVTSGDTRRITTPAIVGAPTVAGASTTVDTSSSKAKKTSGSAIFTAGPKTETLSESAAISGGPAINFPPERFSVCRSMSARLFSSTSESGRLSAARGITQGNDQAPHSPDANSDALHVRNDPLMSRCGTSTSSRKESKQLFIIVHDGSPFSISLILAASSYSSLSTASLSRR